MDINRYVGAPFQAVGRGPAFDCWGLVWTIYREQLGIDLPSYDDRYFKVRDRNLPELIEAEAKKWTPIDSEIPGDVVLIRINGRIGHIGMVVEPKKMIHALVGCNVCIEPYDMPLWRNRVAGFIRYNPR